MRISTIKRLSSLAVTLFLFVGCLSGCSKKQSPDIAINRSGSIDFYATSQSQEPASLKAENLNTNVIPQKDTLGCIASSGDTIYYEACEVEPVSLNYLKSTIYKVDVDTGDLQEITEIENNGETFYSNELICIGNSLFWVYRDIDELKIIQYDIDTKLQHTLKSYPASMYDIILSGDNRFLSWYEPAEKNISLFCYDCTSGNTICLTENAATDSAYTRAYINDGILAYLEYTSTGIELVIHDLLSGTIERPGIISDDFEVTRLQANQKHIICTDGYSRDSSIYLFDEETRGFEKVVLPELDYNIFSCHLFDDFILINSNRTNEIIVLNLATESYFSVETEENILQSAISQDGLFYACVPKNGALVTLDLSEYQ